MSGIRGVPLLAMRQISKRFGAVEALSGVDFEVHAHEVVALVGDNGAGKSTLAKMVSGVLQPDAGIIEIDGQQVAIPSPSAAHELGIATVLGVVGLIAAFGLFYLGDRVFDLGHPRLQTMMYSVAGHLTIFLTRARGPFWSIRPARVVWMAVLGTQTLATLIAVYGLFMTPLGWGGPCWSGGMRWYGHWSATG